MKYPASDATYSQLYFEDLDIGMCVLGQPRQLTREAFLAFAQLSGDTHPIHYDEDYAAQSIFGGCVAHGLLLTSLAALGASPLSARLHGSMVAFVAQDMRFLKPAFVDDWLTPEHRISDLHPSRTKPHGRVRFLVRLLNKIGEPVAEGYQDYFIRSRSGAAIQP